MNEHIDAAAHRAAMHRVYQYLLRLSAQRRAAGRGESGDEIGPGAGETLACMPKSQDSVCPAMANDHKTEAELVHDGSEVLP